MSDNKKLPAGWKRIPLEELIDYIQPTKYIVKSTEYKNEYKTPVLTAGKSFIKGYTNETEGIFKELPVIIFDDFTTATKFVNFPFKVKSSAMKILTPKNNSVDIKYVYYLMQTINVSFDTHKRYWISVYSKLKIPLPSKEEQITIVSKLEALFGELDKAIEYLNLTQQQLKIYRQAVLKWAFEGKVLNQNLKKGELPIGWGLTKVSKIADKIFDGPFGSNLKTSDYTENGIRVIRLENIGNLQFFDEYKTFVSPEKYSSISKHTVSSGDIVFSSFIIDNIRICEIPKFISKAINKADCFCIKINQDKYDVKYVCYFLSSRNVYNQLLNQVHGATRPRINTKQLKECLVPICTIEEQKKIVSFIDEIFTKINEMESHINQTFINSAALRKSILKKAFEGKFN